MWLLLILACVLGCAGYQFQLEVNETGRFVYTGNNGRHRYCTTCETGQNDEINMKTQQSECIEQNFQVPMPDGSKEPICKEGISDAIIPGCGPLPTSDGLSWRTESGRPIQVKSTVYEVYYPICSQNGVLNRDLRSARCGEDLRWNATIQGLRCLYGCGPFPIGSKWRLQNGSEAENESLVGEIYFSECSPRHKRSIVMYCGPDSKWHANYSTPCETDKCEQWYCSVEILIGCSLGAFLGILILVRCIYMHCHFDGHRTTTNIDEESPMIKVSCTAVPVPEQTTDTTRLSSSSEESTDTARTSPGSSTPVEHECDQYELRSLTKTTSLSILSLNPSNENIRVFQALRSTTNNDGILQFIVQKGETVFIATKEKLNDSDCLQIRRQDPESYRGVEMHPFLHCISCVEIDDSGVYYWRTASSSKERYFKFDLKVVDRGQPDGLESSDLNPLASAGSNGDVHEDHTEYHSSVSNPCLAGLCPSLSEASLLTEDNKDEPVCGLQIDTIYRDPIWDAFLKRLCNCLNSSASGRECACWREIAKMYLKRTDAYLSSIEWYEEGDPVNGPAYLILNDVRRAYRIITIGQLAANLQPPNLDLMNCINSFHHNCTFCTRLYYRMHQTRPKDVHG
ncbi:uncharacterized protein LOC128155858 [Crassostrea angulata]|uniref:uncharacterized protein LOC128155858 n=1 Tax=Magallana angulata TaxID=2784310 RepID=UPI0022B1BA50|nr:uncharacterized protein LOC128155858 [Crassostrea angulata]